MIVVVPSSTDLAIFSGTLRLRRATWGLLSLAAPGRADARGAAGDVRGQGSTIGQVRNA